MTLPRAGEDCSRDFGRVKTLRVLIVYDCLYPRSLGGVEKRNYELAAVLAARGHEVTLASWDHGGETGPERVRVLAMGGRPPLYTAEGRRSSSAAARFALATSRLDLSPFDVIETANIPYLHLLPLAARARVQRRPLLVTWHEYWGRYWKEYVQPRLWPAYASIELAAAQAGTRAVAVSELTARRLARRRRGGAPDVVPNGVHAAAIAAAASGGVAGSELIYAGRLLREKRLDLLFHALQLLPRRFADVRLAVIGDGPHRDELRALATALGLDGRVIFRGRLPETEDVWRELGTARIAVQPSSREGFGIFPLEAMAAGLPVVYCQSPESALPELVRDGMEGRMSGPTATALADVLAEVLDGEASRAQMSRAARARAADFDWSAVGARFERVLADLASR